MPRRKRIFKDEEEFTEAAKIILDKAKSEGRLPVESIEYLYVAPGTAYELIIYREC